MIIFLYIDIIKKHGLYVLNWTKGLQVKRIEFIYCFPRGYELIYLIAFINIIFKIFHYNVIFLFFIIIKLCLNS